MTEQYEYASIRVEMASDATLRDYFAAKCMQGMLSNEQCQPFSMTFSEKYHADCAYRMADAMLKFRG